MCLNADSDSIMGDPKQTPKKAPKGPLAGVTDSPIMSCL